MTRTFSFNMPRWSLAALIASGVAYGAYELALTGTTVTLPSGEQYVKAQVSGSLVDSDGQAWTAPVFLVVEEASGEVHSHTITPAANGTFSQETILRDGSTVQPVDIEVWADGAAVAARGRRGPFLNATEGIAGFNSGVPVVFPVPGSSGACDPVVDAGQLPLASPPYVATIQLQTPAPVQGAIYVAEGHVRQIGVALGPWFSGGEPVSIGDVAWDLYSWTTAGFWNFEFRTQSEHPIAMGFVRRGATQLAPVGSETLIDLQVDMALFPNAKRAFFVVPASHQPDPTALGGNGVPYEVLRSNENSSPIEPSGDLIFEPFAITAADYYLQIWGFDATDPNSDYELLTWKFVPATPGAATITVP